MHRRNKEIRWQHEKGFDSLTSSITNKQHHALDEQTQCVIYHVVVSFPLTEIPSSKFEVEVYYHKILLYELYL
jgi:hypothetical protein